MDSITIAVGFVPILFGVYTLFIRIISPEKLAKLGPMKEKFGARQGLIIHTITYSVMPIIFGIVLVYAGFNGMSLAQFLTS